MSEAAVVAAKSKAHGRSRAGKPKDQSFESAELLAALRAFRRGDFSVRLPRGRSGVAGEIAEAFNDVVELNDRMTKEFERLGETVGRQGKINQRAKLPAAQYVEEVREPIIVANILTPPEHIGNVIKLCEEKRGVQRAIGG